MPELLVAWVVFPAVQILIWLGCGSLVARLAPGNVSRALLAPLGFCVVVVVGGLVTAVPALAGLTVPLTLALAAAGLLVAPPWSAGKPPGWLVGALLVIFAVYAAPIVLSGSATFAGYIRLDDTATWLALTDRVMEAGRDIDDLSPSSYEATLFFNLADGYPIGVFLPLGVGQALTGMDAAWLVQPYMALLAVLLALALWELSGRILESARARALVIGIAAQPALLYGYYLWGGIKEVAAAALIALVASLIPRATPAQAGLGHVWPVALAIAALISCLSVAGGAWAGPLLVGALCVAASAGSSARVAAKAAALIGMVALMIAPVLIGGGLIPPTSSPLDDSDARGNLIEALSPLQAVGIWPAGDFRLDADDMSITVVLCVFALGAALTALVVAVRARRWDLAAYLAGVPLAAAAIGLVGSPWVQGKTLAIVSPVVLFAAFLGCAWAWSERRFILGVGVGALLGAGVLWSNALAYSEVNLAPREQLSELEEIGEILDGTGPVLMTEYQPYGVRHFLRASAAEGASELRRRLVPLADGSSLEKGLWADTDDFRQDALTPYEALVLRRSPEQSRPPGEYELEWAGDFYEVWEASGEAATERLALGAGRSPVAEPDCSDVRELAAQVPGGTIRAASAERPIFLEGASGMVDVETAGAHSVWIEGSVRATANLVVDGRELSSVRHELNNEGLYAELGEVDLTAGVHEISVELTGRSLAPGSGGADESGSLAVSRVPNREAPLVLVSGDRATRLCGRPWDWIEGVP